MNILNKMKKNTILLVFITIIVLYFVLKDDFPGIVEALKNMKVLYIILAFIFYAISVVLKGLMNYIIINNPKKVSKKEATSQIIISQFFNGITPFATGGEPMAIYMLTEQKIPVSKATNYMVQSFIFYQIALVICGLFAVLYNFAFNIFPKVQFLQHLVVLGFLINTIVVIMLLLSYSRKITNRLHKITHKLCKLFKIEVKEDELKQKFDEYHDCFQELKSRKGLIPLGITINIISLICLYIVPFFIVYGLTSNTNLNIIETLVSSAYVYLIGAFVPIPGASGGIEYGFTQFFGNFVTSSTVAAMVIVWRFLTYYIGVILGGILFNIRERIKQ